MAVLRAPQFEAVGDMLLAGVESDPERRAFAFVHDGDDEETITYGGLHERALGVAAQLRTALRPGAHVLLLYPPGIDYIAATFGCFYAGAVGVSASPPHPKRLERTLGRLMAIAANAEIDAVLAPAPIAQAASGFLPPEQPLARVPWIDVDEAAADGAPAAARPHRDDLAFLQYTSGSTRDPRGVMLTHANLLANSEFIARAFGHSPESIGFIWLPPYHDMGLIGGILQPLYLGTSSVLTSPVAVIKQPMRWLEGVSRYRATTSGGPNFAYDACVRRLDPEALERLDLSSWEVAFNGAEPIRPSTIQSFSDAFAPCGFRRSAFFPCYGLAEATLMVTAPAKAEPPTIRSFESGALVGVGRPAPDHHLAIVDPATRRRCEPGQIGEIWFSGPSVADGYWRSEEENAATFGATLADDDGRAYLRTGDLGTVADGELFVTGRLKELLIVAGRNHHPHDIEDVAEGAHTLVRAHSSAAFPLEDDAAIALVAEVEEAAGDELDEAIVAVRRAVADELELPLALVALCARGSVPKTTSGKIQRSLCRELLAGGEIEPLAAWRAEAAA
jgi:acyl-CoA synthetase (AMP-forming)/AMP-acid ligase II